MIKGVTKDVCLNNSFPKCAKFMPGYVAMTQECPKNLTIRQGSKNHGDELPLRRALFYGPEI